MAFTLKQNGFKDVRALKGGWNAWLEAKGQTEPKPVESETKPANSGKKK